jgi:hypothetical protein
MGSVDINLGDTLPFFWEHFMQLIGRDPGTRATIDELRNMIRIAETESSRIQMVGMAEPLTFDQVYEPVSVIYAKQEYPAANIIKYKVNSLITGSPGQGKSTFLHWMYREIARTKESVPFLFTLRRPRAVSQLEFVVSELEKNDAAIKKLKVNHFWLLLDGYDEIPDEDRRRVSEQLLRYDATRLGHYILTCRNHYYVYDERTNRMKLGDFDRKCASRYISNFASAFNVSLNPERLLRELETRGFDSFYANPLLLTLVPVKAGQPRC